MLLVDRAFDLLVFWELVFLSLLRRLPVLELVDLDRRRGLEAALLFFAFVGLFSFAAVFDVSAFPFEDFADVTLDFRRAPDLPVDFALVTDLRRLDGGFPVDFSFTIFLLKRIHSWIPDFNSSAALGTCHFLAYPSTRVRLMRKTILNTDN